MTETHPHDWQQETRRLSRLLSAAIQQGRDDAYQQINGLLAGLQRRLPEEPFFDLIDRLWDAYLSGEKNPIRDYLRTLFCHFIPDASEYEDDSQMHADLRRFDSHPFARFRDVIPLQN